MQHEAVLKEFKKVLEKRKNVSAAIVVGSVAKGTATEHSDIDIIVITSKKLQKDTRDNIETEKFGGKKIQLIYASPQEIEKDIAEKLVPRIDQLRHSVLLFDKTKKAKMLIQKAKKFRFNVDIKKRIAQAEDGLDKFDKFFEENENSMEKLSLVLYSFWLGRDVIEFNNSSSTSIKDYKNELKKLDPAFLKRFEKIITQPNNKKGAKKARKEFAAMIAEARKKYA
ncbi:MAG: nucleotidyltransferase domain-containing protein [Candidatus Diapherotrites archaeon]